MAIQLYEGLSQSSYPDNEGAGIQWRNIDIEYFIFPITSDKISVQ